MAEVKKSVFAELNAINVNDHTETKSNGNTTLTYLSWAWAWGELMKKYPSAKYEIERFDNKPYLFDEALGYMVFTKVTIGDDTKEMWLPVMDANNRAMTNKSYKWYDRNKRERVTPAATMFDINKTIMRCLVKNIGMFGLGLYIYAGEDLPEADDEVIEEKKTAQTAEKAPKRTKKQEVITPELKQQMADVAEMRKQMFAEDLATDEQKRLIKERYTSAEIMKMLGRMNKTIDQLTLSEAKKMLEARSGK